MWGLAKEEVTTTNCIIKHYQSLSGRKALSSLKGLLCVLPHPTLILFVRFFFIRCPTPTPLEKERARVIFIFIFKESELLFLYIFVHHHNHTPFSFPPTFPEGVLSHFFWCFQLERERRLPQRTTATYLPT